MAEVDDALARDEVLLVAAVGVVEADLADAVGAEGVQEAVEADPAPGGVTDIEGPFEARRVNSVEEATRLSHGRAAGSGSRPRPAPSCGSRNRCRCRALVASSVAQPHASRAGLERASRSVPKWKPPWQTRSSRRVRGQVEVLAQVLVRRRGHDRRDLGHVDRRERVDTERHAVPGAEIAHQPTRSGVKVPG